MREIRRILVTLPLDDRQRRRLADAAPGAAFRHVPQASLVPEDVADAEVIIGGAPVALLKGARALKWLQLGSAGYDGYWGVGALPPGVLLTCAIGAYGPSVAEHAFAMMLSLMKRLPLYRDNQRNRAWLDEGTVQGLYGKTFLIVGFGDIGRYFARMARPFGGTVLAVRQTAKPSPLADEVHPAERLDELLPRADVVLLSLPGTPGTKGMMDARRIGLMKPGAILLNVGRGTAVDADALCDAVLAGRLFGAGLDVTDPEPLPGGHRLWEVPGILLTPHVAGGFHMPVTLERIVEICAENLARYRRGEALRNLIDTETGKVAKNAPE